MQLTETLADEIAQEALAVATKLGDDSVIGRVAEAIGASSTTMEEAFLTAVRIRRAEARARALLVKLREETDPG